MRVATTTITKTAVVLWLCCCCLQRVRAAAESADEESQPPARHKNRHGRTKSGSAQLHQRTKGLTDGMPAVTAAAGVTASETVDDDGGGGGGGDVHVRSESVLRKYLVHKPTGLLKSLLRTGVDAVQTSMDAFQGVSTSVFRAIKPKGPRTAGRSVPPPPPPPPTRLMMTSDESAAARDEAEVRQRAAVDRKPAAPGLVRRLGDSVATIVRTGIAGAEQITDLGFLVGNIGTHKIRAGLDGQNGNKEIFNLLVKYAASRVGIGAKGDPRQFVDDIGTISTFMAENEEVSKSISTVMDKMVSNPEVIAAMIRMAVTMLQSSPSTECILDQLPLSPSDIRLVFDVFVGSNGLAMIQTIAGLLSSLTTGPDTKAFLESILGMMSMFKGSGDAKSADATKSTSVFGSMTSLFAGGADDADDDKEDAAATKPQKAFVGRKRGGGRGGGGGDSDAKKRPPTTVVAATAAAPDPPADDWFGDGEPNKPKKPPAAAGSDWFDDDDGDKPKKKSSRTRSLGGGNVEEDGTRASEDGDGDGDEEDDEKKPKKKKRRVKVRKRRPARSVEEDEE